MPRSILEESRIHPAIRDKVSASQGSIVQEVQAAVAAHAVVIAVCADAGQSVSAQGPQGAGCGAGAAPFWNTAAISACGVSVRP